MNQLTIANPTDWCTVAYAAELLAVSQRTVGRMVRDGRLQAFRPLTGSRESARHKTLIYTPAVREYAKALALVRVPDDPCDAHGPHPHNGMTCLDCPTCRPRGGGPDA